MEAIWKAKKIIADDPSNKPALEELDSPEVRKQINDSASLSQVALQPLQWEHKERPSAEEMEKATERLLPAAISTESRHSASRIPAKFPHRHHNVDRN